MVIASTLCQANATSSSPRDRGDPEAAIAVASEDVGLAVADLRLDAAEVVPLGVEVAADLDELTGARVVRVGTLDLDRPQAARVIRRGKPGSGRADRPPPREPTGRQSPRQTSGPSRRGW